MGHSLFDAHPEGAMRRMIRVHQVDPFPIWCNVVFWQKCDSGPFRGSPERVLGNGKTRPEATGRNSVARERKELPEIGWCQNDRNFGGFAAVRSDFSVGGPRHSVTGVLFGPTGDRLDGLAGVKNTSTRKGHNSNVVNI